jgi:hypothetical protein
MSGGVSIPTEIVSEIYHDQPRHAGMGMCQRRFGNLPFLMEACQEVYPYLPTLFRQFTLTYQCMCGGVFIPTEIVSEIYHDQLRHAGKGMGMRRRHFGNLLFLMEACQEIYPYPLKLFWQFTLTYPGMLAKVCGWADTVLVIYHSQRRHARRCIHTCRNCF